jgi:hypothetical protein
MVTFNEPTLKFHVITLASPMSDYCMKWLNDLANCLNMFRVSLWTTLIFMVRGKKVIKPWFEVYPHLKVTCLTKFELGVRDLAWRRSLKQSCSICHGEQLLSLGHELIMCIAYSFGAHKNHQVNKYQHLANSAKSCTLTVLTTDLWNEITRVWLSVGA